VQKNLINNGKATLIAAVSFSLIFAIGLRLLPLQDIYQQRDIFFYKDKPILSTYDGYYYLRLAKHYWQDRYHSSAIGTLAMRIRTRPLLTTITAVINKCTEVPLEWIAFFMPIFLSLFLLVIFFLWGQVYENVSIYLLTAIAGMGNMAWYSRSCLGRFDTDCLIPFFMFIIPFYSYKFSLSTDIRGRIESAVIALLMAVVFCQWWHRALFFVPVLLVLPYLMSVFFVRPSLSGILFRIGIVFCFVSAIIAVAAGQDLEWLGGFGKQLEVVYSYVGRLIHTSSGPYPAVFHGLSELSPLGFMESIKMVSGHWIVFVLSLSGLWLALVRKKEALLFFLIPIILGISGFFIRRCLIFTAPLLAFGLGFFIYSAYKCATDFIEGYVLSVLTVASLIFLALIVSPALHMPIIPVSSPEELAVAETLKNRPADGPVWCWWDYGYLIEYVADKPAFINGSTQRPKRVFLSSVPFAADDFQLSANWIRFFSIRGPVNWDKLCHAIGSEKRALSFLKEVFSSPGLLPDLVGKYGLSEKQNWRSFLFPHGEVFLFIPYRMINLTDWWFSFGRHTFENEKRYDAYLKIVDGVVKLNRDKGTLSLDNHNMILKEIDRFDLRPRPHLESFGRYAKNISDLSLVFNISAHKALILSTQLKNTMCLQLLFNPWLSKHFVPLNFMPFQAGVWAVKGSEQVSGGQGG